MNQRFTFPKLFCSLSSPTTTPAARIYEWQHNMHPALVSKMLEYCRNVLSITLLVRLRVLLKFTFRLEMHMVHVCHSSLNMSRVMRITLLVNAHYCGRLEK